MVVFIRVFITVLFWGTTGIFTATAEHVIYFSMVQVLRLFRWPIADKGAFITQGAQSYTYYHGKWHVVGHFLTDTFA
jgi:hypothetical protein